MIRRQAMLTHSKTVTTLRIHVQLRGFVRLRPFLIQRNAIRRESKLIIGGSHDKHGRSIGWNGSIFKPCCGRIDGSNKGGPPFWRMWREVGAAEPSGG